VSDLLQLLMWYRLPVCRHVGLPYGTTCTTSVFGRLTAVSTTLRRRVASIDSDYSQTKLTQLSL